MLLKRFLISSFLLILCKNCLSADELNDTKNEINYAFEFVKNRNNSNKSSAPALSIFSSSINTSCGLTRGSSYCPVEHRIYVELGMAKNYYKLSPLALDMVVAHEFAHAMQYKYGFGRNYAVLNELQADCLAGAFLGIKGINDLEQVKMALQGAWEGGDFEYHDNNHHGFPNQRVISFSLGYGIGNASEEASILTCLDLF